MDINSPHFTRHFLWLATWFEGSLVGIAYLIGWFTSIDPLIAFQLSWSALLLGFLGTVPLFALFLLSYRLPYESWQQIHEFLQQRLAPWLSACSAYQLLYLALLAGITEEILFRGAMQIAFIDGLGTHGGILAASLCFGLVHAITPLYALLATVTGVYLGYSMYWTAEPNLLTPIVIHALYDWLAFLMIVRSSHSGEKP